MHALPSCGNAACWCDTVGSLSPSTPTQPPHTSLTHTSYTRLCTGTGGQVDSVHILPLAVVAILCCSLYSALHSVCCLVHIELAKVCADQNQLQTALEHINKVRQPLLWYALCAMLGRSLCTVFLVIATVHVCMRRQRSWTESVSGANN